MKTLIQLGIALAILLSHAYASDGNKSDKVYTMFSGKDGATSMSFTKSVLEPFVFFLDDDTKQVIYKMKKVRFLSYNDDKGELYAEDVYNRINRELKGIGYFEIEPDDFDCDDCDINIEEDGDGQIRLIGHGVRKTMDEFHMVFQDDNLCILFSFYGDINIEDLKGCAKFSKTTKNITEM